MCVHVCMCVCVCHVAVPVGVQGARTVNPFGDVASAQQQRTVFAAGHVSGAATAALPGQSSPAHSGTSHPRSHSVAGGGQQKRTAADMLMSHGGTHNQGEFGETHTHAHIHTHTRCAVSTLLSFMVHA